MEQIDISSMHVTPVFWCVEMRWDTLGGTELALIKCIDDAALNRIDISSALRDPKLLFITFLLLYEISLIYLKKLLIKMCDFYSHELNRFGQCWNLRSHVLERIGGILLVSRIKTSPDELQFNFKSIELKRSGRLRNKFVLTH